MHENLGQCALLPIDISPLSHFPTLLLSYGCKYKLCIVVRHFIRIQ